MLLAVLEKKAGMTMINQDIYVNVVGGMKPDSTSVDLGVILAVYSSIRGVVCGKRTIAIGEVGLTGEIRGIQNGEKILAEAGRLGYEQIIMPKKSVDKLDRSVLKGSCKVVAVSNIYEAIDAFRGESLGI